MFLKTILMKIYVTSQILIVSFFNMMSPIFQTENKIRHVNLKDVGIGVGVFQQTFKVYIEK